MIKSKAKRSAAFDFMPVVQPSDRVGFWEAFIFHSTVDLKNEKPFMIEEWSFFEIWQMINKSGKKKVKPQFQFLMLPTLHVELIQ